MFNQRSSRRIWHLLLGFVFILILVFGIVELTYFVPFRKRGIKLPPAYVYHFRGLLTPSLKTTSVEREIAFYQQRASRDPGGGLDLAMLGSAYLKMARLSAGTGWYLLAEEAATRSYTNLPYSNKGALLVLANVASFKHDFPSAIHFANEALKVQPSNEDALTVLATTYLAQGDLNQAWKIANDLVVRIPKLETFATRGLVEIAQGKDKQVQSDFKQGFGVEEAGDELSSAWSRCILGRFYFNRGNLLVARALYNEALGIIPGYSTALMYLAELEVRANEYQDAEAIYLKLLQVSQGSPRIYDHLVMRGLARVKFLEGNLQEAKKWWGQAEKLLRRDLNSFGHRRELARLLLERGEAHDVPEALLLMEQELSNRHDAETLNVLAWALSRSGAWSVANEVIQRALSTGIREAEIFYRAGVITEALKNERNAKRFFRKAFKTDPTFDETARKGLGL